MEQQNGKGKLIPKVNVKLYQKCAYGQTFKINKWIHTNLSIFPFTQFCYLKSTYIPLAARARAHTHTRSCGVKNIGMKNIGLPSA